MFEIQVERTIEDCAALADQVNEMRMLPDETLRAQSILSGMSGMDGPVAALGRVISEMEEEHQTLRNVSQGLDKILWIYQNGENRICDNAEQNLILYKRMDFMNVSLKVISEILNDSDLV